MKRRLLSLALAGTMLGVLVAPVGAQTQPTTCRITSGNGAAGLVAAVVDASACTGNIALVQVGESLNNLTALNNVLNNSPVLSRNNVQVSRVVTVGDITALNDVLNQSQIDVLTNFLNNNQDLVNAIVGVGVLGQGTGPIVIFHR